MKQIFKIIIGLIVVDFFYFSTGFSFIPSALNTKMVLAALGLVFVGFDMLENQNATARTELLICSAFGVAISFFVFLSTTYNNTEDYTYLDYVVSMWVWFGGAYAVCRILKLLYGKFNLELLSDNLISVSAFQVVLAFLANLYPGVKSMINRLVPGTEWYDSIERLYGLGDMTALDFGGMRYGLVLILVAYMIISRARSGKHKLIPVYIVAFIVILVLGNFIARTTTIGAVIALVFMLVNSSVLSADVTFGEAKIWGWFVSIVAVSVFVVTFFYNTNEQFRESFRFGFEGFVSLVEEGRWQVDSNDKLATMYVFPDNSKTWIIGDGYMTNPESMGAFYTGRHTEGNYYMGTDVGYLRFIFYFGLMGLSVFSLFFIVTAKMTISLMPSKRLLVLMILLAHFAFWFKVATDCFFMFALLLCVGMISPEGDEGALEEGRETEPTENLEDKDLELEY